MAASRCIIWFRNDLRLRDNSALAAAAEMGAEILPIFIWSEHEYGDWKPGGASRWWLSKALVSLEESIKKLGGQLIIERGESLGVLTQVAEKYGVTHVFWNRRYERSLREHDAFVKKELSQAGFGVKSFNSCLLNEPHTVSSKEGRPYKVYTPYWKTVREREPVAVHDLDLRTLEFVKVEGRSNERVLAAVSPSQAWHRKFEGYWDVSEAGAAKALKFFVEDAVSEYDVNRDFPALEGTSRLSPYLHFGQIGPRQVMDRVNRDLADLGSGTEVFVKEIYWREFAYNVLYHFPHTQEEPLQERYADFPWESDAQSQHRWEQGLTGYPIIDAGMRQLWATGWMHNRVRMIVSSFLVKHLLQDWLVGAKWFWDTLVDADLASNSLGWQWSGGCGADAAPYFRVFNPIIQGKKFDPDGHYVREWVPELSKLPSKLIHEPWEVAAPLLERYGVRMDVDYPSPIIGHAEGRKRALGALDQFKSRD